jgi:two-component system catabolic regulation response regulator CreB
MRAGTDCTGMTRATVLIVEDEPAIAENVAYALRTDGFAALHVTLAADALRVLATQHVDAVVLDVGLPDGSGFDLCRQLRRHSDVPVLFVTARGDEVDRVVGLEIGADDYVVKPFSPRELVARVKTILRRVAPMDAAGPAAGAAGAASGGAAGTSGALASGAIAVAAAGSLPAAGRAPGAVVATRAGGDAAGSAFSVDEAAARIRFRGRELALTAFEYRLLCRLLAEPGRVFTREQLMLDVAAAPASMARTVDTHIKSLRGKLRAVAPDVEPIRTHRGFGYSLQPVH